LVSGKTRKTVEKTQKKDKNKTDRRKKQATAQRRTTDAETPEALYHNQQPK
jgi:hypothetical protein